MTLIVTSAFNPAAEQLSTDMSRAANSHIANISTFNKK
jgi:hypothetical protein